MDLYEVITTQIINAINILKNPEDEVVIQVFQIGDRNTIYDPIIFKDNNNVFATDMNGRIHNLNKYGEVKVGITTHKKTYFNLRKYQQER